MWLRLQGSKKHFGFTPGNIRERVEVPRPLVRDRENESQDGIDDWIRNFLAALLSTQCSTKEQEQEYLT
jgi:hypothetical protein